MTKYVSETELVEALKNLRFWLRSEVEPNLALRGHILHPADAAHDIALAVERERERAQQLWHRR